MYTHKTYTGHIHTYTHTHRRQNPRARDLQYSVVSPNTNLLTPGLRISLGISLGASLGISLGLV